MDFESEFNEQEEIIVYIKKALDRIAKTPSKTEKKQYLFQMLAVLISSANDVAEQGDIYEAAGRLYSAAYYLEEYYYKEACDVYKKAAEYYDQYFQKCIFNGEMNDAANVAIKIATIYETKLKDLNKFEEYLEKAINIIKEQINLLNGFGTPQEACLKYQTLAMLYGRLQRWEEQQKAARNTLDLAKKLNDHTLIANAYNDIIFAYEKMNQTRHAQDVLLEEIHYFTNVAEELEAQKELIALSQVYQIIKHLYSELRQPYKYRLFSKKEAGTYIAMAKLGLLYNYNDAQIASFYRGAALCYQEVQGSELDAASCFFLAGNYYKRGKKFVEASINYEDAARIFDQLNNNKKAFNLFLEAAKNAIKGRSRRTAIENLIWANQIAEQENYENKEILELLIENLLFIAKAEAAAGNFFVAGTLFLEAAYYQHQFEGKTNGKKEKIIEMNNKKKKEKKQRNRRRKQKEDNQYKINDKTNNTQQDNITHNNKKNKRIEQANESEKKIIEKSVEKQKEIKKEKNVKIKNKNEKDSITTLSSLVIQYLKQTFDHYWKAVNDKTELFKPSSVAYVYALIIVIGKLIESKEKCEKALNILQHSKFKTFQSYGILAENLLKALEQQESLPPFENKKIQKLFDGAPELQKLMALGLAKSNNLEQNN